MLPKYKATTMNTRMCGDFLQACQNADGGFGPSPGMGSEIESTRFAVDSLKGLGAPVPRQERLKSWASNEMKLIIETRHKSKHLLGEMYYATRILVTLGLRIPEMLLDKILDCRTDDGCFSSPGRRPNIDDIYYACHTLAYLHVGQEAQCCADFIESCRNVDGGYSNRPGGASRLDTTYCAVHSCYLLTSPVTRRSECSKWIRGCREDGGFALRPRGHAHVAPMYWALATANLLGVNLSNKAMWNWILAAQQRSGGFKCNPSSRQKPETWYTYCAIHAYKLLSLRVLRSLPQ